MLLRVTPPVKFAHSSGKCLTMTEGWINAEATFAKAGEGRDYQQCDVMEKTLFLKDDSGNEHALTTNVSSYDLWDLISITDNAWSEDGFFSSPCHPKRATLIKVLSNMYLWSDTRRPRTFLYAEKILQKYETISLTEHLLSGHIDLYMQKYEPFPSGQMVPHDFVISVELERDLESERGHGVPSGSALWFRVYFQKLGWLHTQRPSENIDEGIAWETLGDPVLLQFTPTGMKSEPNIGIHLQ